MASAVLTLFWGCGMEPEEFCSKAMPEFERRMAQAFADLPQRTKIVIRTRGRRSPAAVDRNTASTVEPTPARLTAEDRERWREWSQERLEEIQNSLDVVADNPEMSSIRRELSSAADHAVAFYGFATAGNLDKMRETLSTLDSMMVEVKRKVCPQPSDS